MIWDKRIVVEMTVGFERKIKKTSAAGFEPTRAWPNGFQVHLLNQLGQTDYRIWLLDLLINPKFVLSVHIL